MFKKPDNLNYHLPKSTLHIENYNIFLCLLSSYIWYLDGGFYWNFTKILGNIKLELQHYYLKFCDDMFATWIEHLLITDKQMYEWTDELCHNVIPC